MSESEVSESEMSESEVSESEVSGGAGPKFDPRSGLVPAIAQDWRTGRVLMLAWMNAEAWRLTLETGRATYWSRSRAKLWVKGESSGHTQRVVTVRLDCDQDAVLLQVEQVGPACHTDADSCFSWAPDGAASEPPAGGIVERLGRLLAARAEADDQESYTARLLKKGIPKINAKIAEESAELQVALQGESDARVVSELADVIYHALVGLQAREIAPNRVWMELGRRFGTSGLVEKASRHATPTPWVAAEATPDLAAVSRSTLAPGSKLAPERK